MGSTVLQLPALNCYCNPLILHKIFTCMTYYHFNEGLEIIASQRTMPDCLGSWPVNLLSCRSCWLVTFDRIENEILIIPMLFSCFSCYQCTCSESLCIVEFWSEILGEMQLEPLFAIGTLKHIGFTHFQSTVKHLSCTSHQ